MPNEKTQKLPLVWDIATRDGTLTKDAKMGNVLVQQMQDGMRVQKRPGLQLWQQQTAAQSQGMFTYSGELFAIFGTPVGGSIAYQIGTTPGGAMPGYAIPSSSGAYDYQSVNTGLAGGSIFKSHNAGYTFNGVTVSVIPAFPTGTCWGLAYLDTTFYVVNENILYASAPGDVTTWPGLNYVTLNTAYGTGVAIVTHLAYIAVFMELGVQFFYDAGLSPGAPVAQVQNGAMSIGCAAGETVASYEDVLYLMSRDVDGALFFGAFTGLTFSRISTPAIERILQSANIVSGNSPPTVRADCGVVQGKPVYLVSLSLLNITLCYDIQSSLWTYWTTVIAGVEGTFNGSYLATGSIPITGAYSTNQSSFVLGLSDGAVYRLSSTTYQDNGQPINTFIRTPSINNNTYAVKFVEALYLHSDTIATTVAVTYSNNDYQTFATSRTIDMSTQKKQLIGVGSYRHRSWDLLHTDNTPYRVSMLELDMTQTDDSDQ